MSPKYLHMDLISLVDVTEHFEAFRVLENVINMHNSEREFRLKQCCSIFGIKNGRNNKVGEKERENLNKNAEAYQLFSTRMDAYTKR